MPHDPSSDSRSSVRRCFGIRAEARAIAWQVLPCRRGNDRRTIYLVGTRRFSSSSQCWTTMSAGGAAPASVPGALIIRKRWPSGDTSYVRPGLAPAAPVSSAPREKLHRRAGVPHRAARLHRHAQQRAVGSDIEQFLAAPRPEWLRPPRSRDLPLAAADVWKGPDVDFKGARTVGLVRQPPAVGRDDPVVFVELRLQQRCHPACPVERELQHIVARSSPPLR